MSSNTDAIKTPSEETQIADLTEKIFSESAMAHSPYPKLDDILDGIHNRIYLFSAAPGLGKSTLFENLACNFAQEGHKVLYANLEMPHVELVKKAISLTSNKQVSVDQLAHANDNADLVTREIKRYKQTVSPNMFYTNMALGAEELEDYARNVKKTTGQAPIVFLDYCQLLKQPSKITEERLALSHMMDVLRRMTTKLGTPVFAISAMRRTDYSRSKVGLDALAASQSLEYGSDVVISLARNNDEKDENDVEEDEELVNLTVLKNRYGASGSKVSFAFNPSFAQFREL